MDLGPNAGPSMSLPSMKNSRLASNCPSQRRPPVVCRQCSEK